MRGKENLRKTHKTPPDYRSTICCSLTSSASPLSIYILSFFIEIKIKTLKKEIHGLAKTPMCNVYCFMTRIYFLQKKNKRF